MFSSDASTARGHEAGMDSLRRLIRVRYIVIVLIACVMLIGQGRTPVFPYIPVSVLSILLLVLFYNSLCWFLLGRIHNLRSFLLGQLILDTVAETSLLFFTGGVHSSFIPLYFASIVGGSMLVSRRDNAFSACLATMGLAVVTLLQLTGTGVELVPEVFRDVKPDMARYWGRLLPSAIAFFTVAYLSGVLQSRLAIVRILNEEILLNMPEGVVVFDSCGRVVFLNPEFVRLFPGGPGKPAVGDNLESIFSGPIFDSFRSACVHARNWRFELEAISAPAGDLPSRPPLEVRLAPIGESGSPRGVVAIFIDVSLRQQVEESRRRADRSEAVGQMAAGLAHEIRNPLASVRGSIQEVARDFPEGSSNRRLCDIVIKESDRLDIIITDFLQFARSRPLHVRPCNLYSLLAEVRDLLATRSECARVELDFESGKEAAMVLGDEGQIREVFLNLGVNAAAAMKGEGRLTVCVRHFAADESKPSADIGRVAGVLVSLADTGPGLLPGTEHRIFEPFYTTKPKGTGLGLATAQRVVQAHNGALWVKSVRGVGATFYCWLPEEGPEMKSQAGKERVLSL